MIVAKNLSSKNQYVAFCILAHKNIDQLSILIDQILSDKRAFVFLHIDAKARFDYSAIKPNDRIVCLERSINASWGDISLVDIMILMMKEVESHKESFGWVSMHSGLDLLVRPSGQLIDCLFEGDANAYIESEPLPIEGWGRSGGFERVEIKYPEYLRDRPTRYNPIRYVRYMYQLAYFFRIIGKRNVPQGVVFLGGSQWFTIDGSVVREILKFLVIRPDYYDFFKDTLIPDEIFFQTLLGIINKESELEVKYAANLRYIEWDTGHKLDIGAPATLRVEDIAKIENSQKYIARKFDSGVDAEVIRYFSNNINHVTKWDGG